MRKAIMRAEAGKQMFQYGDQRFEYVLEEIEVNRLRIEVLPNLNIHVQVPRGTTKTEVEARLRKKARWVFRSLAELSRYHPLPHQKKYRSGESVFYLGRQYYIKLIRSEESRVRLMAGSLEVYLPDPRDQNQAESLVEEWYMHRAEVILPSRFQKQFGKVGLSSMTEIPLRIRYMKTRWGSCSAKGTITLNPELVKTPSPCIDYVILHELCHLRILNHSQDFYRLLTKVCSDWKIQKKRLNECSH